MGVASLVLGIVSFIFAFVPCLGVYALVLAIVGLILGICGLNKANKTKDGKGLAIAGFVLCILATVVAGYQCYVLNEASDEISEAIDDVSKSIDKAAEASRNLKYQD